MLIDFSVLLNTEHNKVPMHKL